MKKKEERIEKRQVKLNFMDEETVLRWVIYDTYLGYYRTKSPLQDKMAWNRSLSVAHWFLTKKEAEAELKDMAEVRRMIFREMEAGAWEENAKRAEKKAKFRAKLLQLS